MDRKRAPQDSILVWQTSHEGFLQLLGHGSAAEGIVVDEPKHPLTKFMF